MFNKLFRKTYTDDEALKLVSLKGSNLKKLSNEQRNNKVIVLTALDNGLEFFQYAGTTLKKDIAFIRDVIKEHPTFLQYTDHSIRSDKDLVEYTVSLYRNQPIFTVVTDPKYWSASLFEYASSELRDDREYVLHLLETKPNIIFFVSNRLKMDKDLVLAVVTRDGSFLNDMPNVFRRDKDVVLAAVQNDGCALKYTSDSLRDDNDIVMAAVIQDGKALRYASARLRLDPVIKFISEHKSSIFKTDWDMVLKALLEKPNEFFNPDPSLRALTEGMDDPYLILAQHALNKDAIAKDVLLKSGPYTEDVYDIYPNRV